MSSSIIAILFCTTTVTALPTLQLIPRSNFTNHGDPHLSCTPKKWSDIASFFLGNYAAHAATVKAYPGEGGTSTLLAMLGALLLPTSGLLRGLNSIMRLGTFYGRGFSLKGLWKAAMSAPDYRTAAASGALCMLVRTAKWRPRDGDVIKDVIAKNRYLEDRDLRDLEDHPSEPGIERLSTAHGQQGVNVKISPDPEPEIPRKLKIYKPPWISERCSYWIFSDSTESLDSRTIHGSYDLKEAAKFYALVTVPRDAIIERPSTESTAKPTVIASSYNFPSALIAVLQFTYATVTLVQTTRGAQIDTYGYAAFGLTVVPYAMMSLVNLMSALTTPSYSTMFMVKNEVMDEAIRHGARFDGVVGRLCPESLSQMEITITSVPNNSPPLSSPTPAEISTPETKVEASESQTPIRVSLRNEGVGLSSCVYTVLPLEQEPKPSHADETSPLFFIPSCSRFQRSISKSDIIDESNIEIVVDNSESQLVGPVQPPDHLVAASLVNGVIIIAVIGGLTHFRQEQSTHAQRTWLMVWYIMGFVAGVQDTLKRINLGFSTEREQRLASILNLLFGTLIYGIPSIGGFVVVGQMLLNYGICTEQN